jgi:hypothetical protein
MKGVTKLAMAFAVLAVVAGAIFVAAQPIKADVASPTNSLTGGTVNEDGASDASGSCGGAGGCKATCGCGCGGNPNLCGCGR